MIYDCFTFYNELDLLDIRLHTLNDIVDKFVLVESTVTFTNQPKSLYYQENKHLFKKFQNKIIHVVIKDSPNVSLPWIIEHHQLGSVTKGLPKCKPTDIILVSCVDEIPKPEAVLQWRDKPGKHKVFLQKSCHYYLNYVAYGNKSVDHGTRMFTYKDLQTYPDPYIARFTPPDLLIPDGGWHFSYMGGIKAIQKKLASYSHQEYNNDTYNTPEHILASIAKRKDILGFGMKFRIEPITTLPQYVQDNKEKFSHLIFPENKKNEIHSSLFFLSLTIKKKLRLLVRPMLQPLRNVSKKNK